jgi:Tfp pilus assembly protein PilF
MTEAKKKEIQSMFDASEGTWDDVIDRHFEYLGFYPTSHVAFYNLGFAFAQRGQADNAERAFLKALELKSDFVEAIINMGGLAYGRCDWDKSIEYNKKALAFHPDLVQSKANVAYAYLMKDELETAVELFKECIKQAPQFGVAHYGLAITYDAMDNTVAAKSHYTIAVQLGIEPEEAFKKKMEALGAE